MYQVLARKYRPKNFHQLIGQDHVAKALTNAINHQRLHHAYLFTGTRGVGKTTIARILAKCLNCETGVTSQPCGVCSTCQDIDAGRFIDLIEIDAASRTKVEDTRELLDNVPYAPTQGRYKVYLIDEVHMLSTHSFNALLKTLEEPPEHVKFLLATTDPQKLPVTIVSRCLQFVLRPLPQPQLAEYLGKILTQEQISFSEDALWQLATSAKGSVRDALSLTDQAIAFGNGKIEDDTIASMLGLIDQADVVTLLTLIYQQQTPALSALLQQLRQQVVDAKAVFDRLAEVLHQVALLQLLPDFDLQMQREQYQNLQQLAKLLPAELVQLYYEIVVTSREKIALANTPAQALEMCLLRMLAFKPLSINQIPVESVEPVELTTSTSNVEPSEIEQAIAEASIYTPTHDKRIEQNDEIDSEKLQVAIETNSVESVESTDIQNSEVESANIENANVEVITEPLGQTVDNTNSSTDSLLDTALSNDDETNNLDLVDDKKKADDAVIPTSSIMSALSSNQNLSDGAFDPLSLRHPQPQPLEGEWTVEKWDYWVSQAREHRWLNDDELALARIGKVTGQINGESTFITHEQVASRGQVFNQLREKIRQLLAGTQLKLQVINTNEQISIETPVFLQEQRDKNALMMATKQMEATPVLQELLKQNATLNLVKFIR